VSGTRRSAPRSDKPNVHPDSVLLTRGKGSKGRGGSPDGKYWHITVDGSRAGFVYINVIDEPPVGRHASIQIQLNANAQGRAIGRVAYRAAVNESSFDEVYAHMRKSNIASRTAAEYAGFVEVNDVPTAQLLMRWRRDP
jgi:RimJ/RimL family protein N-acetyltransferase